MSVRIVGDAPVTVRVAAVLVGLQGLASFCFGVAVLVRAFGGGSRPGDNLYGEAAYFVVIAAAVLAVAANLLIGRRWARTPSLVIDLLLLLIGWYLVIGSHQLAAGLLVIGYCLVPAVLLFLRPSREWAQR